jgi:hypothetical protein
LGRFEGQRFDPEAWKSRVPAAAVLRADDEDTFWAARRVAAFSDELIRALVKTGRYSHPADEEQLAGVLIQRRDKIAQVYLTRLNPLVDFSLDNSGVLTFDNAAVKAGAVQAAGSYEVIWSSFDNRSGGTTRLGEAQGTSPRLTAPASLPQSSGSYVLAEVRMLGTPYPSWAQPVRVYFRRLGDGWKLVGLERSGEETAPAGRGR